MILAIQTIQQATLPHIPLLGTFINVATVLIGGTLGLVIGNRLPERIKAIVIAAIGLMTLVIGISSALKTANALIPLLALVIGGIIGELVNIDGGLTHLGEWLKKRVERPRRRT